MTTDHLVKRSHDLGDGGPYPKPLLCHVLPTIGVVEMQI